VQQLAAEEAEALGITVVGEHDARALDRALWRSDDPAAALPLERDRGGLLEEPDRWLQAVDEPADVGGGLHDHRPRHVDSRGEGAGARYRRDRVGVECRMRLAEPDQLGGVVGDVLVAVRCQREVVAAAGIERLWAPSRFRRALDGDAHRAALQRDVLAALLERVAAVVLGRDLVRQVDDETRVASRGSVADDSRLQHCDVQRRVDLRQPAGGGEAGKTAADHGDIGRDLLVELPRSGAGRQLGHPAADTRALRELRGLEDLGRGVHG
jgi:hypothetical protein